MIRTEVVDPRVMGDGDILVEENVRVVAIMIIQYYMILSNA